MFANGITQQYFKLLSSFVLFLSLISFPSKEVTASYVANGTSLNAEKFEYSFELVEQIESFQQNTTGAECNCGSLYSEGCYFVNGKKVCNCIEGYAQNKDTCQECNCEPYRTEIRLHSCYFKDGNKVCQCLDGYAESFGICASCECGPFSLKCEFSGTLKKCTCEDGYLQINGKCEKSTYCDCGSGSKRCDLVGGSKKCTCFSGYFQKEDRCVVCGCGSGSISCYDLHGIRKCICERGYYGKPESHINPNEECVDCRCGFFSSSCYLDWLGNKRCNCDEGYIRTFSFDNEETCKRDSWSSGGWRLATIVEGFLFGTIIIALLLFISHKKCK